MAKKGHGSPLEEGLIQTVRAKQDGKVQAVLASQPLDSDVVDYIDTQSPSLNYAIGRPGIPVGRMTLLVGKEKSGKSTILCHLIAETQQRGGLAFLIDSERRYSRDRGERIGIDHDRLIYLPGDSVEETFLEIENFVEAIRDEVPADVPVLFGWDSLSGTALNAELKHEESPGGHARGVGKGFRVLLPMMARKRIAIVFVSQLRNRIDMGGGTYFHLPKDTMIAERALNYHCSLRIHLTQIKKDGPDPKKPDHIETKADIQWNTVAPPFRSSIIHIRFLDGIDRESCAFEVARDLKLITQNASWWVYEGQKFQRNKWPEILKGSEELQRLIESAPLEWLP